MNLLKINVFILWFQSEFWNDFVAMKLLFSRINEERKRILSLVVFTDPMGTVRDL